MPTSSEILALDASRGESAVAWSAVLAGAVGAAALSLILILLGTGLGLAVISPWSSAGPSAEALGWSTILWVTLVQSLASVLGGYLAGRLRTRWTTVHTNEVFFRDTAHGFLAWAVATLLMASLLSAAITGAVSTGVKAAATAGVAAAGAGVAASQADENGAPVKNPLDYYVDLVLRAPAGDAATPAADPGAPGNLQTPPASANNAEVGRTFAHGIETGELSQDDVRHLGRVVAARTGTSQADAERRVTETFEELQSSLVEAGVKAKTMADEARKASALTALWLVVSLLLGAFLASLAATFGGRLRDSASIHRT